MAQSAQPSVARAGALSLALAGILFVLYPAIRPFSDEASLQGAAAFGSTAWFLAHTLAMVAFTLLPLGLWGLHHSLQGRPSGRTAFWALLLSWLGIGLTLPFYGAETFGLYAIGREALAQQRAALMPLAHEIRTGAGLLIFVTGLLLLAVGAIMAAMAIWNSSSFPKWSGVPFAVGFLLYLPQFAGSQPLRVAHGALVAAGCLWVAAALWQQSKQATQEARDRSA